MQRSVIQLAGKTLIVSLPSAWCKENGVKKGGTLEVTPRPRALVIETTRAHANQSCTLSLGGSASNITWHRITTAYRSGFTSIAVRSTSPTIHDTRTGKHISLGSLMHRINQRLVGFEVTQHSPQSFTLKEISAPTDITTPDILSKMLNVLLAMYAPDSSLKGPAQLEHIQVFEDQLNTLTDFARRLLLRENRPTNETIAYSQLLDAVEALGDVARDIARTKGTITHFSSHVRAVGDALRTASDEKRAAAWKLREMLSDDAYGERLKRVMADALNSAESIGYSTRT